MSTPSGQELIVVDTSFDATVAASRRPWLTAPWPTATRARLDAAVLVLPIFSEAEIRAGWLKGGFSAQRVIAETNRISRYLRGPFDQAVVDHFIELHAAARIGGWNIGDNDLWIAATARSRRWPLATCDGDHGRLSALLDVILLTVGAKPAQSSLP